MFMLVGLNSKQRTLLGVAGLLVVLITLIAIREIPSWANTSSFLVWEKTKCDSCAVFLDPKSAELYRDIGNYYFGGGAYDLKKAEEYYRAALALNETLPGGHYQLARIHFIQGALGDALKEINKELEMHPEYVASYYTRGLIYGYGGLLSEAESDFKTYLKLRPESWAGHNDLAWIYFSKGEYGKIVETTEEGLKYSPHNPWLLNSLGVALLNLNKKTEAKEALEESLSVINTMTPEDWGVAYPGNDPAVYADGFAQMKASIQENLKLLESVDNE